MPDLSPSTARALRMFEGIRRHRIAELEGLSEAQALAIPSGSRNSLHWHVGHLLHVQLAHWYVRRGLPLPAPVANIDPRRYFRDGRSPADYDAATPSYATLLSLLREYSLDLEARFGGFLDDPLREPFVFLGMDFKTLADDLYLLIYHEGEHAPMIDRLRKAIAPGG